jgi:hypothetical protein
VKKVNQTSAFIALLVASLFLITSCQQAPKQYSNSFEGNGKSSATGGTTIHSVGTITKTTVSVSMEIDTNNDGKVDKVVDQKYVGQKIGDRIELPSGKLLPVAVKQVAVVLPKKPSVPTNLGKTTTMGMTFPQTMHIALNASETNNGLVTFKMFQAPQTMHFEMTVALAKKFNQISDSMSGIDPGLDQKTGVIFSIAKNNSNGKYYIKDLYRAPVRSVQYCDSSF